MGRRTAGVRWIFGAMRYDEHPYRATRRVARGFRMEKDPMSGNWV
jgi:hypothetical protein